MKIKEKSPAKPKKKASETSSARSKGGNVATQVKKAVVTASLTKKHFPAPWHLNGEGFIFPLFANQSYNLDRGFFDEEDRKNYRGGLGSLMLVNYKSSDVGPYYEILYIPGNFEYKDRKYKRITRIFVSSQDAVDEGIRNWAIPKERADFLWQKEGSITKIEITRNGKIFLRAMIKTLGFNFPVSASPFDISFLQKTSDGEYLETAFTGRGNGKLARLESFWADDNLFPNFLNGGGFKTGLGIDPFNLDFPVANKLS
ncbi:acetoacetate decarboxylase [Leptospira broomii]|nr:acetoacetate decarboxylase [Leptospira broomii]